MVALKGEVHMKSMRAVDMNRQEHTNQRVYTGPGCLNPAQLPKRTWLLAVDPALYHAINKTDVKLEDVQYIF